MQFLERIEKLERNEKNSGWNVGGARQEQQQQHQEQEKQQQQPFWLQQRQGLPVVHTTTAGISPAGIG